mmetsp:Transcript_98854/g.221474  ORF Transcript_98854/g.221474 Transcript_98854/m.221474 type:complete len:243 (-) Transcript_98854:80-808(-)
MTHHQPAHLQTPSDGSHVHHHNHVGNRAAIRAKELALRVDLDAHGLRREGAEVHVRQFEPEARLWHGARRRRHRDVRHARGSRHGAGPIADGALHRLRDGHEEDLHGGSEVDRLRRLQRLLGGDLEASGVVGVGPVEGALPDGLVLAAAAVIPEHFDLGALFQILDLPLHVHLAWLDLVLRLVVGGALVLFGKVPRRVNGICHHLGPIDGERHGVLGRRRARRRHPQATRTPRQSSGGARNR